MRNLLVVYFTLLYFFASAQLDYGHTGKKNLVAVSTNSGINLFYNAKARTSFHDYVYINPYSGIYPWTRVNYRVEYKRLLTPFLALGIEAGLKSRRLVFFGGDGYESPSGFGISEYVYSVISPFYNSYSLMPTLTIGRASSIGFSNFSFQVGIGPTFHKLNKSKTKLSSNRFKTLEEAIVSPNKMFYGLNVFAQFNYRLPLFGGLFFDFGLRVDTGFTFGNSGVFTYLRSSSNDLVRVLDSNQNALLQEDEMHKIFSLKLGLAYQF